MENSNDNKRISNMDFVMMVGVAIICDLLGPFGAVGGPVVFFIWFKLKGVPIIGTKQIAKQAANLGLNALGEVFTAGVWAGVTVGVILTIVFSRIEDKTGGSLDLKSMLENPMQTAGKLKEGLTPEALKSGPANDNAPGAAAPHARPQMNDVRTAANSTPKTTVTPAHTPKSPVPFKKVA